jgi:hypothetical protein
MSARLRGRQTAHNEPGSSAHSRKDKMQLSLDHLIIRSPAPAETLAQIAAQAGTPLLADVERVSGVATGIVRAGSLDIEVVGVGDEPPQLPHGYGIGFVADGGLDQAVSQLRAMGFPTSPAPVVSTGSGPQRRAWRATQVHGLLPDPFPAPTSTRRLGLRHRALERAAGVLARVPPVARAATRRAGSSMVVVTEYAFDVLAWRSSVESGPRVVAVHLGIAGHRRAWEQLPLAGDVPLHLEDDGLGVTRVLLARTPGMQEKAFSIGDVAFEFGGG